MLRLIAVLISLAVLPAAAANLADPSWPCVQRKQPHLSPGAMWTGPLPETPDAWKSDDAVARLVPVLAVRRTTIDEAEAAIAGFAEGLTPPRDERLALLFQGLFETIDRERSEIISGIGRYAGKQSGLSSALDATRDEVARLEAIAEPSFDQQDRLEELRDKLAWDTRIFRERMQSLTYVCESPVLLEQRIFSLAQAIQRHLE